jgi:hypothetical protein
VTVKLLTRKRLDWTARFPSIAHELQPLRVGSGFFRLKMRETFYESVEAPQGDLDDRLVRYNTERPHLGYRNQGRRPLETINLFVSQEG